ncbi:hypothetical protein I4U23_016281 [Adineta vaga]|nr:hypothetical protein I4U23_016281 [Adineta vaga]
MLCQAHAAVVKTIGQTPICELVDVPSPTTNQIQVQVIAVGIHQIVRSIVNGQHYTKVKTLPMIPGVDGVGTLPNGKKVYFIKMAPPNGTMSQLVNVDKDMMIPLPDNADPIVFAAIMNAGLASWTAITERAQIQSGETVLVLGVTGSSGQMAATSARLLGAKHVIGVGRNQSILDQLVKEGTIDVSISLSDDLAQYQELIAKEAADADIVMDFLWGKPTEIALAGIHSRRKNSEQRLRWIQIGQMAGTTIQLPGGLLRSKNIEMIGSGLGSISLKQMLKSLETMIPMVIQEKLTTSVLEISLTDIEKKWQETTDAKERVVVVM